MSQGAPVWLITGCSTGIGRVLAERIVERGWRLIATARDVSRVADLAVGAEDRVLPMALDVADSAQIARVVAEAQARFQGVDVLVNNAGYGYQSTAEEGEDAAVRAQFDANVFGLFAMTRAVLPLMRARRRGHIINVTSVAGLIGLPGSAYYVASKHAVEGFSDTLRAEVAPIGIGVTCIEPGPFRTDFAGRSLHQARTRIADYEDTAGARQDAIRTRSGTQPGDPGRAADAIIAVSEMAEAPRHVPLGRIAFETIVEDRRRRLAAIERLEDLALSADFPTNP